MLRRVLSLPLLALLLLSRAVAAGDLSLTEFEKQVTHGFATNGGVRIHYASLGQGPLAVFVHGFPDFWLTWRHQMAALAGTHQAVALDLRGYNLSDHPKGVEQYDMAVLVEDVASVIRRCGREKAVIIGHDWGGAISWAFAMRHPEMTERLVILNLPHPRGFLRELAGNPQQQKNSAYARSFQQEGAHEKLKAEQLAGWVKDPEARARYLEAFGRSDFEAMLNYYKRHYPRQPYQPDTSALVKVKCPVLMFHGLDDTALLADGLNGTWNWLEQDLTLITVPHAGHFVQQDAAELVTRNLVRWLQDGRGK